MKRIPFKLYLFFCFAQFSNNCFCQKVINTYYSYDWKEIPFEEDARFYSHCIDTDSGWYRNDYFLTSKKNTIQMSGLYEDKENKIKNGTFRWYYPNLIPKQIGKYVHGKKQGLWLEWYSNGSLKDSLNYLDGNPYEASVSWYKNGDIKDSMNLDKDGNGIYVAWFDNGNPSEGGRYKDFHKSGKWAYYHKNGNISSMETYKDDTLQSFQYYDENGVVKNDTITDYAEAYFAGGEKAWKNYVGNYLHAPLNISLENTDHIIIVVGYTVDEDGNVIDADVTVPFHPLYDNEALRFIKDSPKWIPAVSHNRKVRSTSEIPITFGQRFD